MHSEEKMKIAICDDEKEVREQLKEYCMQFAEEFQIDCQIVEYGSGEELLCDFSTDVLLLDVEMKGIDGIQVKNILQEQKADTRILFISSHEEAIPEAFGREVYGFLCKPVEYEVFEKKMTFLLEDILEQNKYIVLETKMDMEKVLMRDIVYIKAEGKYTKVFLAGKEDYFLSDYSINKWHEQLNGYGFELCQRSYLVNFYYIKKIDTDIILQFDTRIPLSRRMKNQFKEAYSEYIWRKAK